MVPRGSYIVVQDSAMNGHPTAPEYGPGPYEAVEVFLAENGDFATDRSQERLLMTNNPMGFLGGFARRATQDSKPASRIAAFRPR